MNKKKEDFDAQVTNNDDPANNIESIDESSDPEIKRPFDPKKIDMTLKPLIIDSLIKRMASNPSRIDLNTEFQRRGNLWSETAQSRLIESLLVRIPLPAFYFDGTNDEKWKVVDGLQRLTTLKRFIIEKTLKLTNLEFLKDKYENYGFKDLPPYLQTRIEEAHITVYIINPGTPDDVKYNIFKRINTGGLMLTAQEIRHALNQGTPADFVKELADLPEFHQATHGILKNHKRMEDRDFVTRFIAFYHQGYEKYQSELDDFLNNSLAQLNNLSNDQLMEIKKNFSRAMSGAYRIFNDYAFRKRFPEEKRDRKRPLNKALFDAWAVNLALLSDEELHKLVLRKDVVNNKFIESMKDENFRDSISLATGKINAVKTRFYKIKELIQGVLTL